MAEDDGNKEAEEIKLDESADEDELPLPEEPLEEKKDDDVEPPFEEEADDEEKAEKGEGKKEGGYETEEKTEEKAEEKEKSEEVPKKPRKERKKKEPAEEKATEEVKEPEGPKVFALRTTANREDQVMDFITSNIEKRKDLKVYSVIRPHGMRGYIFIEAGSKTDAELVAMNIPYSRGILPKPVEYSEMEHMLEQVKHEVDIRKNDIAEIITGPFKREQCKVTRIDKAKEEVVVELLEAAVPIPITVKMDAIKVIRREGEEEIKEE